MFGFVGTANARPPDEWVVASSYTYDYCIYVSGTIEDTYHADGDTLDFFSQNYAGQVDFEFGNLHAKQVKLKVAGYGGWFERFDLWIYYTDTTYKRYNGVSEGSIRYYTIDYLKVVDFIRIGYYSGWFMPTARFKIDLINILWTWVP